MEWNYDRYNWMTVGERLWQDNAERGYIAVSNDADDAWCMAVGQLVERWQALPETKPAHIVVNVAKCGSGSAWSFYLAKHLATLGCDTMAGKEAGSAGLFLFMAGTKRVCHPQTRFLFHGNLYRWMQSGASDAERAAWFAGRTAMEYDWWLETAQRNGPLEFGAKEALAWGVATEVAE